MHVEVVPIVLDLSLPVGKCVGDLQLLTVFFHGVYRVRAQWQVIPNELKSLTIGDLFS